MRIILLILAALVLFSCGPSKEEVEAREKQKASKAMYKVGDVAYTKPDSVKVAIISIKESKYSSCGCGGNSESMNDNIIYNVRTKSGEFGEVPEGALYPRSIE